MPDNGPLVRAAVTHDINRVQGGNATQNLDEGTRQLLATIRNTDPQIARLPGTAAGRIVEVWTLDQFHSTLKFIPETHGGPTAFCGATAPATALALHDAFDSLGFFNADARVSFDMIHDTAMAALTGDVREKRPRAVGALVDAFECAMAQYGRWRKAYLDAHPADVKAEGQRLGRTVEAEKQSYLGNWIANYEISDWLRQKIAERKAIRAAAPGGSNMGGAGSSRDDAIDVDDEDSCSSMVEPVQLPRIGEHLLFFRANQFPERIVATYEEKTRIEAEESRFGGNVVNIKTGEVRFGQHDRSVVLEAFGSEGEDGPLLLKPDEYLSGTSARGPVKVVVVDLKGHYATAVIFRDAAAGDRVTTILFNTLGNYANNAMLAAMHDTVGAGLR